ncbi:hypothetical protein OAJ55_02060 [Candidatus Nitrosopelagicus sp.]|nr:hypothetical protein [Candidatus Nitrosopelagicus sp.]
MVFGWGKKKKQDEFNEPVETIRLTSQSITLDEIPKVLDELITLRKKTLVAEIKSHRNRLDPQREIILKVANELEDDDLNSDDLDPHFQIMVNRGKKEVIAVIKREFSNPFPEVNSAEDVIRFKKVFSSGINKIGDMLGKHSRLIHILAKKYAKKFTDDFVRLTEDLKEVDSLIANFSETEEYVQKTLELKNNRTKTLEKISKQENRMIELRESLDEKHKQIHGFEKTIDNTKSSSDYKTYQNIQSQLEKFESEKKQIRHHIDDQFTKISRPLGKFVHISSHDKEIKDLTATLASTPYDVLDENNLSSIKNILDSIVIGIDSGSVSVKDVSKSKDGITEIKNAIPNLINIKLKFETKKKDLITKLENFDLKSLQNVEKDLKHEQDNILDIESKLKSLEDETLELTNSLPGIIRQIEMNLKDVTSISYIISVDPR